ncbi:MAG: hypothetical protein CMN76_18755 [Spirochaetaceae bacterium]|nr:hypothetical protein [Spirochaetaceae bacterium]|tara:strand:+ start:349256 stop:349999 length:744 start_codon:yes stop_codon:yes gene_type:complete
MIGHKNRSTPWILATAILFFAGSALQAQVVRYRSNAYDIQSGKYMYTENHAEHWQNGKHAYSIVTYTDPQGQVMAVKKIVFTGSKVAPNYDLSDKRSGLEEGARVNGNSVSVYYKPSASESKKSKALNVPSPIVVDGGFDYFVRQNMQSLMAGKTLTGNFTVSHRLDYFPCRIYKVRDLKFLERDAVMFVMEPTNIVIRQLADPIYIIYDKKTGRLLRFTGVSNLEKPDGSNYRVHIVFRYPDELLK